MKTHPPIIDARIKHLLLQRRSATSIAAELGVSRSSVLERRKKLGNEVAVHKGGRPRSLTRRDIAYVTRYVMSVDGATAESARRELLRVSNKDVSTSTIRRQLRSDGNSAIVKKKRPRLLPRHRKARRDFISNGAKDTWDMDKWSNVIWSDETKINLHGSDGRQYVWKRPGEKLSDRLIQPTVKYGGGSIMIWGCMTYWGVGRIALVEGRMNANDYIEILDANLLPTIADLCAQPGGPRRNQVIFQQDNDSKHTSRAARAWFLKKNIKVLDWPPQSPDLNPIEHLWGHLKRRLRSYPTAPSNVDELWERVKVEWANITPETCLNLIDSMPRRVAAVRKARGSYSKY